jgi:serine/threonine protein kinase
MIVKNVYILVNKMTIILDSSIFKKINIGNFRDMFNTKGTVVVNGRECIITGKNVINNCFKIGLKYRNIYFQIYFKFKSDEAGSLTSINMMFLDNTRISDDMIIIRHLGAGSFGDVFLVSVAGKEYALKVGLDIPRGSETISAIQNEMNIFQILGQNPQHPNLIRSFPIEFPLGPAVFLELGQETLDDKIKSRSLSFQQTIEIILQILSAVAFLHSIGISHNDLKPDNVLFVDGVPKLFDFNLSYHWEKDDSFRSHLCGTRGYKHPSPTTNYAQDGFSCCFILIEMLIGENIRSYNSKTPSGIAELSIFEIEIKLRAKGITEENIQKILLIYSMRTTIELRHLIELAQSIQ